MLSSCNRLCISKEKRLFKKVCKSIYGSSQCYLKCKDQYMWKMDFTLKVANITDSLILTNRSKKQILKLKKAKVKTIALILESPHVQEYANKPIGPAKGQTGNNINNFLWDSLKKHGLYDIYKLILIEAVPYPCSNLKEPINTKFRDETFLEYWNKVGENRFYKRLKRYKPNIIVNSCTGGINNIYFSGSLNNTVQEVINKYAAKYPVELFYSAHPSGYNFISKGIIKY